MLLVINAENPQPRKIAQAVEVLEGGGVVVYPTDTFYGIGCDLFNKKAIERIYKIKHRPLKKPFSFICADLTDIAQYAIVSNYAYKTMRRLLPGPYTFILRGTKMVPKIMQDNRKNVGLRMPDNRIALSLVMGLGHPVISTSAAFNGQDEGTVFSDPSLIHDHFGHLVDLVIDGGPQGFEPSSVISLIDDRPEVLRLGKGNVEEFLAEA